jgi:hypothetical protein
MKSKAANPKEPILKGRNRPSDPRRLKAEALSKEALSLRLRGKTFPEIARLLVCSSSTAHDAVQRGLMHFRSDLQRDADELRAAMLGRIDTAMDALWPRIEKGDEKAIDRMIKLDERRAELLGLNRPIKVAPVTPDGDQPYQPLTTEDQRAVRIQELLERARSRKK